MILLNGHTDPFLAALVGEVQFSQEEINQSRAEAQSRQVKAEARNAELRAAAPRICLKCSGRGTLREFAHVDSGVCFTCRGSGALDQHGRPVGSNQVMF